MRSVILSLLCGLGLLFGGGILFARQPQVLDLGPITELHSTTGAAALGTFAGIHGAAISGGYNPVVQAEGFVPRKIEKAEEGEFYWEDFGCAGGADAVVNSADDSILFPYGDTELARKALY